jgi:hypothetical protein
VIISRRLIYFMLCYEYLGVLFVFSMVEQLWLSAKDLLLWKCVLLADWLLLVVVHIEGITLNTYSVEKILCAECQVEV